jgi:poly [ADP-ribose] polymerase
MKMAETIEVAKTGRSKCRVCRENIEKGVLRYGEEQPSAFAEGMQWVWHHLACAAKKKPVNVRAALETFPGEVPNRAELDAILVEADKNPSVLPYVEHAPTGRSKCQQCQEPIEKGALRIATERPVEEGVPPRPGAPAYLHPKCAPQYIETENLMAILRKNSRLPEAELQELEQEVV